MPCTVKLLPVPRGSTKFHDFDEYERLVEAARLLDPRTHLIVLLAGEAGLRRGEMIALEWSDVDLGNRQLCVRRSDWNGQVTTPKGRRLRHVPMTRRLAAALSDHRHLRSTRVLCQDDTEPFTRQIVQTRAKRAARKAGLAHHGVHILRHTFGDAWSARTGHPGTRRAYGPDDDAASHAPESGRARQRDQALGAAGGKRSDYSRRSEVWRRGGDGGPDVKTINKTGQETGGEAGIRTLGRAFRPYNGLANRRLQPLGHLTADAKYTEHRHLRKASRSKDDGLSLRVPRGLGQKSPNRLLQLRPALRRRASTNCQ